MESAATPTKPKRSRAVKPKPEGEAEDRRYLQVAVNGGEVTQPLTHSERMAAVDARAADIRQRVLEEHTAKGYGPMPRTGVRWMGRRTKGLPYSRMLVEKVVPGMNGLPGLIYAKHPTRKTGLKKLVATPAILETFMPSLPASLSASMLGLH